MARALLGNGLVNTSQLNTLKATIEEYPFYAMTCKQPSVECIHNNGRRCFPWGPCKGVILKTNGATSLVLGRIEQRQVRTGRRERKRPVKTWCVIRIFGHSEAVLIPEPGATSDG
jgi:hypothetical protein